MATTGGGSYGIVVGIVSSSTPWQQAFVQRAVTSTGLPSSGSTMWAYYRILDQQSGGSDNQFTDYLPNDGVVRHYRARGSYAGYTPSSYCTPVSATPTLLTV